MDTRAEISAATRNRLLQATATVVAERGGAGLTMQAVAEAADVALRTVYNYFPTKEALALEAYNQLAGEVMSAIEALPVTDSPRDDLSCFVETFVDGYQAQIESRAMITGVPGIPELDARVEEVRAWRRDRLTKLIHRIRRDEPIQVSVPQAVGLAFLVTAFPTWEILVNQNQMTPAAAKTLLLTTLERSLFG